ncbi:MAG TPA: cutinase family protein [Mycobacterium sp.]
MKTTSAGRATRIVGAVVATAGALPIALIDLPAAGAAPCPDVEIVFARGTTEPPGVGGIGQAFVDSLRSQVGGRSVGVYPVNYPASNDFDTSTPAGSDDASAHVQAMAASCPNTRMVLGGYSQGAAVVDLATTYMPPDVADNVAAAAVFGGPRSTFADSLSPGPLPSIGPLYTAKTIELCVPNDPICFQGGWDMRAHGAYVQTGMVNQAASFAASRL